jgi:hypothetical protein
LDDAAWEMAAPDRNGRRLHRPAVLLYPLPRLFFVVNLLLNGEFDGRSLLGAAGKPVFFDIGSGLRRPSVNFR